MKMLNQCDRERAVMIAWTNSLAYKARHLDDGAITVWVEYLAPPTYIAPSCVAVGIGNIRSNKYEVLKRNFVKCIPGIRRNVKDAAPAVTVVSSQPMDREDMKAFNDFILPVLAEAFDRKMELLMLAGPSNVIPSGVMGVHEAVFMAARLSQCSRRQVGAVMMAGEFKEHAPFEVMAFGYNSFDCSRAFVDDCASDSAIVCKLRHAEVEAIELFGQLTNKQMEKMLKPGGQRRILIASSYSPCGNCAKHIVDFVKKPMKEKFGMSTYVTFEKEYENDTSGIQLLCEAGVPLVDWEAFTS